MEHKNTKLFGQATYMEDKLVRNTAAKSTIRGQIEALKLLKQL